MGFKIKWVCIYVYISINIYIYIYIYTCIWFVYKHASYTHVFSNTHHSKKHTWHIWTPLPTARLLRLLVLRLHESFDAPVGVDNHQNGGLRRREGSPNAGKSVPSEWTYPQPVLLKIFLTHQFVIFEKMMHGRQYAGMFFVHIWSLISVGSFGGFCSSGFAHCVVQHR